MGSRICTRFRKRGKRHRHAASETDKITGIQDRGMLLCGVNGWRSTGTHIVVWYDFVQ